MFPVFGAGENTVIGSNVGGTATRVLFVDANGALAQSSKLTLPTPDVAGQGPSITAGTAVTDVNALSITQTWNEGSTAFTTFKVNVTNTASAATSLLADLQVASSSKFKVDRAGSGTFAGSMYVTAGNYFGDASRSLLQSPSDGVMRVYANDGSTAGMVSLGTDTGWSRGAAGLHLFGTGAAGSTAGIVASAGYRLATVPFTLGTAPTLASGGCTTPGAVTANGTAAFSLASVGTSCSGSQPLVFTLPAATTGWNCTAKNVSNGATSAPAQTGAVSTTSVTITNFGRTTGLAAAWTDADVVVVSCLGY